MAPTKQRRAARRNIRKAQTAAERKRTIAHLPKATRWVKPSGDETAQRTEGDW